MAQYCSKEKELQYRQDLKRSDARQKEILSKASKDWYRPSRVIAGRIQDDMTTLKQTNLSVAQTTADILSQFLPLLKELEEIGSSLEDTGEPDGHQLTTSPTPPPVETQQPTESDTTANNTEITSQASAPPGPSDGKESPAAAVHPPASESDAGTEHPPPSTSSSAATRVASAISPVLSAIVPSGAADGAEADRADAASNAGERESEGTEERTQLTTTEPEDQQRPQEEVEAEAEAAALYNAVAARVDEMKKKESKKKKRTRRA